ncbi:NAD(P)-binding domain-containing protein [Trichocoleus sp. FACHB-591]|uniref:NAD(P)-binding domain-containing protein n=1 Tax=Trichocoleus sp. FACHB-591 TaxID=2692872 RepID=UPI001685CE45|nr:NAD(P)-binding domain-containing protein [Trichocoleus sp. FACHB-591]MBD2097363.1 NAD(P)-binding domain-containing protein [Trichocoleus sp. FACHB-591]
MATERVCIIGAGSSGIAAAKTLHQKGIAFDCFEKGSGIGGNWRYLNDNGMSSAYKSLHINSSKRNMEYSDFPMPDDYPDYPRHSQILDYFESYIDHFGLRNKITFRTEVVRVTPLSDGTYSVTIRNDAGERTEHYRAVIVANGHHWCPKYPDFPGQFSGMTMHSHNYKTPDGMSDKNILVVGIGNSACDIACETSRSAKQTFLSTRRSAYILPKYILGRPLDSYLTPFFFAMPLWLRRIYGQFLLFLTWGSQAKYGVPAPKHQFLSEHPTITSDLLNLVGYGRVKIKPNVRELAGDRVRFEDGTEEPIDIIIYGTGYKIVFPFFDQSFIDPQNNELPLYKRVIHPDYPNLYFIGLFQPIGAIMPIAEWQSKWVAGILEGTVTLPSQDEMKRTIKIEQQRVKRQYIDSTRHTMQVDFHPYINEIKRELKRNSKQSSRRFIIPLLGKTSVTERLA